MKRIIFISICMVFILSASTILPAQEKEETPPVFSISTWKVRFDKIEEFLNLWEKESLPLIKQNEFIKSFRVCTHLWGPDWTVVSIAEYESFSAIEDSQKKSSELFKKKYPDKAKRDEVWKKMRSLIMGHTDAIVEEVPKLRK